LQRDAGIVIQAMAGSYIMWRRAWATIVVAAWSLVVPLDSSSAQPGLADPRRGQELAAPLSASGCAGPSWATFLLITAPIQSISVRRALHTETPTRDSSIA
jgi:hypothetical protein